MRPPDDSFPDRLLSWLQRRNVDEKRVLISLQEIDPEAWGGISALDWERLYAWLRDDDRRIAHLLNAADRIAPADEELRALRSDWQTETPIADFGDEVLKEETLKEPSQGGGEFIYDQTDVPTEKASMDPSFPGEAAKTTETDDPTPSGLIAGYRSDRVDPSNPDLLGIEREVRALGHIVAARAVSPPLSLGLFGDWGSGKSFFMAKLRRYVAELAEAVRTAESDRSPTGETAAPSLPAEPSPAFCARIVQVEFNAWHYADANLWASLVTHIFDVLARALAGSEEDQTEARLQREQQLARALVREAEREREEAERDVENAQDALQEARQTRAEAQGRLAEQLDEVGSLLTDHPAVHTALQKTAEQLNLPPMVAQSYQTLKETAEAMRGLSERLSVVGHQIASSSSKGMALGAGLAAVALPLLLWPALQWAAGHIGVQLSDAVVAVTTIAAYVGGVAEWGRRQLQRADTFVGTIEGAYRQAAEVRERRRTSPETRKQQLDLEDARLRESSAREALHDAEARLQRIEHELREFAPGRQLERLIVERSRGDRYRQHLGIISLIREDFDRMGTLFKRIAAENESAPIERIVLYVDDLDRCQPQRVVEVLEAVHLLMASELFVVIVAVDPRWLRQCLADYYPTLLGNGQPDDRASSPQDYLEKIFQIPFTLRPVQDGGYRSLVSDLLQDPPARSAAGAGSDGAEDGRADRRPGDAPNEATWSNPADLSSTTAPVLDLSPEQLRIPEREQEALHHLSPLFATPRTIKRFVNIYRLLRVSLPESGFSALEGRGDAPGEYRAALLLLAVVAGQPNLAPTVLRDVTEWGHAHPAGSWKDLLSHLAATAGSTQAGKRLHTQLVRIDQAWRQKTGEPFIPNDGQTLAAWAERVSRFSFSVHAGVSEEPSGSATVPPVQIEPSNSRRAPSV